MKSFLECLIIAILFSCLFSVQTHAAIYMSVAGKVLYRETSEGVPNVKVYLSNKEVVTDSNGNFVVRSIENGTYTYGLNIFSLPEGYYIDENPKNMKVVVKPRRNIANLKIHLKKGASITGKVYAEDGTTPLDNVILKYTYYPYNRTNSGRIYRSTQTNSDGFYSISGLSCFGPFVHLELRCPGYTYENLLINNLSPGETRENENYVFKPKTKVIVKGQLIDSQTNEPIEDASVEIFGRTQDEVSVGFDITSSTGNFQIKGLVKCVHGILIKADGYETLGRDSIDINQDLNDLGLLYMTKMQRSKPEKSFEQKLQELKESLQINDESKKKSISRTTSGNCCDNLTNWQSLRDCVDNTQSEKTKVIFDNKGCCDQALGGIATLELLTSQTNTICEVMYLDYFFNSQISDRVAAECMTKRCCNASNGSNSEAGDNENEIVIKCCLDHEHCCMPPEHDPSGCAWHYYNEDGSKAKEIFLCPDMMLQMSTVPDPDSDCYCSSCVLIHEFYHSCDPKLNKDCYVDGYGWKDLPNCEEWRAWRHTCESFCSQLCEDVFVRCLETLNYENACRNNLKDLPCSQN